MKKCYLYVSSKVGKIPREQAVKLKECLSHIDEIQAHKATIEKEIYRLAEPCTVALDLLKTTPGLDSNPLTPISVISEIGVDMSVFRLQKILFHGLAVVLVTIKAIQK